MWQEKIIKNLSDTQIINDSKTPSGRVHVGSLRGVLIHDAVYRSLLVRQINAEYRYGVDDFDPMDGLPADAAPQLQEYMGHPLCNIPAPEHSAAADLADHYIAEFLNIFNELGVNANIYRMRDVYRSGQFNEAIDTILHKADIVRKVYADVSGVMRPTNWLPFQVICEQCGKIGTTEVTQYNGKEVVYECKPNLVSWAKGCGWHGSVSPLNGNGKLSWKLEWVAKWHSFGITIEGAGKDHCTKGGSRDVAAACLRLIFGKQPPMNIPYEFFLVSGAKMSSSKGVGTSAREMANLLPPEILRFLMIRTPPKKTVNFSTDFEYVVKLYNEYDRLLADYLSGRASETQKTTLRMTEVSPKETAYHTVGFQLLTALTQLPHIDIETAVAQRQTNSLSTTDKKSLHKRLQSVRYWLEHFATEADRVELQTDLPTSVANLSEAQRAFLNILASLLPTQRLNEDAYQRLIFDAARLTPLNQPAAFQAIYRVLLDKDHGPKGGALLSYLEPELLSQRFSAPAYSEDKYREETCSSETAVEAWLSNHSDKIKQGKIAVYHSDQAGDFAELTVTLNDEKSYMLRLLLTNQSWLDKLAKTYQLKL